MRPRWWPDPSRNVFTFMFGTSGGNRTHINQLSVATGYKSAVLPLNYRGINRFTFSCYHYTTTVTNPLPGFEPGLSLFKKDYFICWNEPKGNWSRWSDLNWRFSGFADQCVGPLRHTYIKLVGRDFLCQVLSPKPREHSPSCFRVSGSRRQSHLQVWNRLVLEAGIEPARHFGAADFKSAVATDYTTRA